MDTVGQAAVSAVFIAPGVLGDSLGVERKVSMCNLRPGSGNRFCSPGAEHAAG